MISTRRERVAVIGSGVAGLTAAYVLQQRFDVSLYEADDRLGGHAHTHDVVSPDAGSLGVDSGFIVHNQVTYPHLLRLFRELGVATQQTEMSMSIHCDGCGLEYAGGKGIGSLFAQPRSLTRPAYLRMLTEVKKFHRQARQVLASGDDHLTLGEFLTAGGYSTYFTQHFMVPFVSCVWSSSQEHSLRYPARYLFVFLDNHGSLSVKGSHQWRTVTGGSRTYVEKVAKGINSVRLTTPVRAVSRHADGVVVHDADGGAEDYQRVVVATHADTALGLLTDPTTDERELLSAFGYSRNETLLHNDARVLPTAPRAAASWNYRMPSCSTNSSDVMVSYDMNRLQTLPTSTPYIVSLNATERVDTSKVIARMTYEHPIYTLESVAAQSRLSNLNDGRLAYAGAYHGWGFHEDGCRSGVEAARSFGCAW